MHKHYLFVHSFVRFLEYNMFYVQLMKRYSCFLFIVLKHVEHFTICFRVLTLLNPVKTSLNVLSIGARSPLLSLGMCLRENLKFSDTCNGILFNETNGIVIVRLVNELDHCNTEKKRGVR